MAAFIFFLNIKYAIVLYLKPCQGTRLANKANNNFEIVTKSNKTKSPLPFPRNGIVSTCLFYELSTMFCFRGGKRVGCWVREVIFALANYCQVTSDLTIFLIYIKDLHIFKIYHTADSVIFKNFVNFASEIEIIYINRSFHNGLRTSVLQNAPFKFGAKT